MSCWISSRECAPDVLESFQDLVDTGGVELLGETYYHSLASLASEEEFIEQVERHRRTIERSFGQRPTVFRNTELIYCDDLAPTIARLGYRGVMVEGADHVMGWRSSNFVYEATTASGLRLLPQNYRLSDDIAFRFSNRGWDELAADGRQVRRLARLRQRQRLQRHLFVDYETFGEHQWADTGHLRVPGPSAGAVLPARVVVRPSVAPGPADAGRGALVRTPTSWADVERDTTAWLGNRLQHAAQDRLYGLRSAVLATGDARRVEEWRRLTTSDHLYYMCTKWFADGDVHKYFSPYESPYDAFIAFMNVTQDLEQAIPAAPSGANLVHVADLAGAA